MPEFLGESAILVRGAWLDSWGFFTQIVMILMAPRPILKNALVTGSSSGIGRAIAIRLARDGFHVLVHYHRGESGARDTLAEIENAGGTGTLIQFDVADAKAMEEALETYFAKAEVIPEPGRPESARGAFGARDLEVLVNNAGIHSDTLLGLMSDESFDSVMKTNVYGPFYLMRWVVRKMLRQRRGTIVNVASLAGQTGNAGQANYAASKAALIAMTKSLCMEVGSRGIRVNAVAPGFIETPMIADIPGIEAMRDRIPLKRFGRPDEVAGAVSFLCSADAGYVNGHTLSVNGGLFPA